MTGAPGQTAALPVGLQWPGDPILANVSSEIFKLRNARDTVIGVALRTVAHEESADVIDWVVHIPARGSLFVNMDPVPEEGGRRVGQIRAGSREFRPLSGMVAEQWISTAPVEEDAPTSRIELLATYASRADLSDASAPEASQ